VRYERATTDSHKLGRWQNAPRGQRAKDGIASRPLPTAASSPGRTTNALRSLIYGPHLAHRPRAGAREEECICERSLHEALNGHQRPKTTKRPSLDFAPR
jgi:hypothetical protein